MLKSRFQVHDNCVKGWVFIFFRYLKSHLYIIRGVAFDWQSKSKVSNDQLSLLLTSTFVEKRTCCAINCTTKLLWWVLGWPGRLWQIETAMFGPFEGYECHLWTTGGPAQAHGHPWLAFLATSQNNDWAPDCHMPMVPCDWSASLVLVSVMGALFLDSFQAGCFHPFCAFWEMKKALNALIRKHVSLGVGSVFLCSLWTELVVSQRSCRLT